MKTTNTWIAAAFAATTLAACGTGETTNTTTVTTNTVAPAATPTADPTTAAAPAAAGGVQIAGDGLSVGGKTIAFGTPRTGALTAISAGMGGQPEKAGTQEECGPGPLAFSAWDKGLQVNFQDDKFVGWNGAVDLKTAEGIGFGSTRAALDSAYHPKVEQTSLGYEFTTDGGLSGVLESEAKDATVSEVWAGMTCVAR